MFCRRAWKRGSVGPRRELVVRREADLAANLVELARLAEHPAQPLRQGERSEGHHQEGIMFVDGARDQSDDIVCEPGSCRTYGSHGDIAAFKDETVRHTGTLRFIHEVPGEEESG